MLIDDADRPIVRWAIDRGYLFEYCRPSGLPEPCLRIRLGLSRAYFHKGKLTHWSAEAPGDSLDHLMQEMTSLFSLCAEQRAYVNRHVFMSPADHISLRSM